MNAPYYPTLFSFYNQFFIVLKAKVVLTVFNVKLFPVSAESAFIFALCYFFFFSKSHLSLVLYNIILFAYTISIDSILVVVFTIYLHY